MNGMLGPAPATGQIWRENDPCKERYVLGNDIDAVFLCLRVWLAARARERNGAGRCAKDARFLHGVWAPDGPD